MLFFLLFFWLDAFFLRGCFLCFCMPCNSGLEAALGTVLAAFAPKAFKPTANSVMPPTPIDKGKSHFLFFAQKLSFCSLLS